MVLADDNFATIVTIVRWGRSVYANIQKFVQFQLTVNLVALSLNFIAAVGTGTAPLTTVQLLWVNLIMDTMGALALGTEPPREELMKQKPYGRDTSLITSVMWRNIIVQSVFQLVLLVIYTFEGYSIFNLEERDGKCEGVGQDSDVAKALCTDWHEFDEHEKHEDHDTLVLHTIIFNTFVFCQIFNEINARHMERINVFEGIQNNLLFVFIIVITAGMQVVLIETPASNFAGTTSISTGRWLICVGVGALSIPLAALGKLIPVPDGDTMRRLEESYLRKIMRAPATDMVEKLELVETQLKAERSKVEELAAEVSALKAKYEGQPGASSNQI
uniref:P-type Ca(2+) transporter n=1 Tax=Pyramimonas obovata TaxID=1411642 RepID=A0A7S0WTI2_9CHLO|mmetsp:Transcript_39486/g.85962  ORF Transcript_39486/g.85962 Transcript_39486/m.85962 type:complete len:331 (+) Transcript_39486:2-994(+)